MDRQQWRTRLGETVRNLFLSPEMEAFYSVPVTPERARIYFVQLGHYVRHRRDFWPQVAANCPHFEIKQLILAHEYEEIVEDEHSASGHFDLVLRQAREVGLDAAALFNGEALPTTKAANYAWAWIARHKPWQEALVASTIAEWTNDDRLLGDIGGGNCTRLMRKWRDDLGFTKERMPNFVAHSRADEKHSDMFLAALERYVPPEAESGVLATAREAMEIHGVYFGGMAAAMARARTG